MSKQLMRYTNPTIIDHIASHYVLGTLSTRARNRTEQLLPYYHELAARVDYWQQSFIGLDEQTEELVPQESTWQAISAQIDNMTIEKNREQLIQNLVQAKQPQTQKTKTVSFDWLARIKQWFALPHANLMHAASVLVICLLSFALLTPDEQALIEDPLSYVAVLTNDSQQAQLVASTYGESKKLVVNIINTPDITTEEDLELWVVSKTDHEARSLGIIPRDLDLIEQQLSEAQWRLIKDSASLIVTIEDLGGSSIGEPSDTIVSRGLCVQLKEWNKNA